MRLCLNMIVRNEMANLERCLGSIAPHIACWAIVDTGSTDGTPEFIRSFFAERGVPGDLLIHEFRNFEEARNVALGWACVSLSDRDYPPPDDYHYLLLADADMELVWDDDQFARGLTAEAYRLEQRTASGITYWNTRLVRRDAYALYHGVTHEYLEVRGNVENLSGAWYRDHASGANRPGKLERDVALLTQAILDQPGDARSWFYLAQSYRDLGRFADAADLYHRRTSLGGWEEEAWYARLQFARCLLALGDEANFLRESLYAFNQRPWRAEPIYDIAKYYRERGLNDVAMTFSEGMLGVQRPSDDLLFVEDYAYAAGFREEYSICAYYSRDPARRARGYEVCRDLAHDMTVPVATRALALSNLRHYQKLGFGEAA